MSDNDVAFEFCEDGECNKPHHHMHTRSEKKEDESPSEAWEE